MITETFFKWSISILFAGLVAIGISSAFADQDTDTSDSTYVPKSKSELKQILTEIQYQITQESGTERAFSGAYWDYKEQGVYACVVCNLPLFDSKTKYDSGTGWPSFWKPKSTESIDTKTDWKLLYPRTEVHCKRCKAHLGHVFDDGPQPTGKRYCMNSAALRFDNRLPEPSPTTIHASGDR